MINRKQLSERMKSFYEEDLNLTVWLRNRTKKSHRIAISMQNFAEKIIQW